MKEYNTFSVAPSRNAAPLRPKKVLLNGTIFIYWQPLPFVSAFVDQACPVKLFTVVIVAVS
jgi:hypothetical protein